MLRRISGWKASRLQLRQQIPYRDGKLALSRESRWIHKLGSSHGAYLIAQPDLIHNNTSMQADADKSKPTARIV